jgi:glutamate N-acetyltransferase/amino-acid N-acetyltransferase
MSKTPTTRRPSKAAAVPGLTTPKGFRAAGGVCGIKASGNPDLAMIVADAPCPAAGVFTTNKMKSEPVLVDLAHLRDGKAQAIICNSGNANASTGRPGYDNALLMCRQTAAAVGCQMRDVLVSSTGIIGRPLPMEKIARGIATLASRLDRSSAADAAAARAIMTTDLVPKTAYRRITIDGKAVHLAGICKGSGMIAPNMATMLAFVTTDAVIDSATLKRAIRAAAIGSFNRMSVDQHTSPSDTVLILASGKAGHPPISRRDKSYDQFTEALTVLCADMAYQIVKDGEGATKVFRVRVAGARNEKDADRVGRAVVDSPLVKTAVHGGDPNWGRITTAAGYSGASLKAEKMSLYIGHDKDVCVFARGVPTPVNKTIARKLNSLMKKKEVVFTLDLGMGKAEVEWLGCDLSRQYIAINADYTT